MQILRTATPEAKLLICRPGPGVLPPISQVVSVRLLDTNHFNRAEAKTYVDHAPCWFVMSFEIAIISLLLVDNRDKRNMINEGFFFYVDNLLCGYMHNLWMKTTVPTNTHYYPGGTFFTHVRYSYWVFRGSFYVPQSKIPQSPSSLPPGNAAVDFCCVGEVEGGSGSRKNPFKPQHRVIRIYNILVCGDSREIRGYIISDHYTLMSTGR